MGLEYSEAFRRKINMDLATNLPALPFDRLGAFADQGAGGEECYVRSSTRVASRSGGLRPTRRRRRTAFGVEIECVTNALERVRPVRLPGQEPALRLSEGLSAVSVLGEAMLLYAIERVLKDGNHEPLLGCLPMLRSEVLGRQHDVGLHHTNEQPRQSLIRFHSRVF